MNLADNFKIKMILGTFTVEKGKLKVLLYKKQSEPYKGYWSLPKTGLTYDITFESSVRQMIKEYVGIEGIHTENFKAFEDKETALDDKIVHVTTIGIIDSASVHYKKTEEIEKEIEWFDVDIFPKLAYNGEEILASMVEYLKLKLKETEMIKLLFPSDFTLPELQIFCETILGKKLDRRNFRKKVMSLNIIEETGYKSLEGTGRPANLYRFKDNVKEINLF